MGSRILSRSFQVPKWEGESQGQEEDDGPAEANTSIDSAAMDVDDAASLPDHGEAEEEDHGDGEEDDEENEDDPADVAMVPMADMLNARFESENVSNLFHGSVGRWLKP